MEMAVHMLMNPVNRCIIVHEDIGNRVSHAVK